jgi:hypothetical protein
MTRAIRAAFAAGATRAKVQVSGMTVTAEKIDQDGRIIITEDGENEWDAPLAGKESQ